MRYWSTVFLFLSLVSPLDARAGDRLTPRPLDAAAAEAFERAQAHSALVRSLVATLESSNVIVHIQSSRTLPYGIGGTTRFVTSRGGYRYVRITIGVELPRSVQAGILGHELQHACEVAGSLADDMAEVRELFEREGQRSGDYFETRAAVNAERHVRSELQNNRALQAEPVVKFDH